jgi:phospholipid/cholesterol/gamma-HCH transport system substrate-binding protein
LALRVSAIAVASSALRWRYVSYFNESVQGLEVGSPIKFRGVNIGTVGKIDVAPDHRLVEVTSELGKAELSRLGLDVAAGLVKSGVPKKLVQAIDLRVQLVSSGLTGVKFLQLDFFTVADHPRPVLPFAVPKNYIPAASSTLKDLEDSLVHTMNNLPKITDQVMRILDRADKLVLEVGDRQLVEHAVETVAAARRLVGEAHLKVAQLETGRLSAQAEKMLVSFGGTATRANGILARLEDDRGLLKSLLRASNAFGDTARNANGLGAQLDDTLRAVEAAAKSIHKVAGALEIEPDMLVKGREKQR